jgi:molybdate transport system ATP-binding protein
VSRNGVALEVDVCVPRRNLELRFVAQPGITILFGPSGAGKSTTLNAIAGLERPDRGLVKLGDEIWFDGATGVCRPVHLRGLAFVFQSLALFPHMTAVDNVEYGIDRAMPPNERRARALQMLSRMKVAHVADRKPSTFSGGEAQRVALARAFARQPRVVLLDEPFSALDRDLRVALAADVRAWVEEMQVPLIHVTHQRNEARAMGNHVVMLEHGRVVAHGEVDSVLPFLDDELPIDRTKRL